MKSKALKKTAIVVAAILGVLLCVVIAASIALHFRTVNLHDDYSRLLTDEHHSTPVYVSGIQPITQDVSCGYAVIEMFSAWDGGDITEESLYAEYGKVVTSTGKDFCDEMNKQFPAYMTTMYKYLPDSELLASVYASLERGIPVPFEWAAQLDGEWTLHYSLVIGMDIPNDKVIVANPYGYIEEVTITEFLNRTSFGAYENMPRFLKLGFAFGIFEKNAVFIVEPRA